jgi:hypothetical protein
LYVVNMDGVLTMTGNETQQGTDRVPLERGAAEVEAWFAAAGLEVAVVDRCSKVSCPVCDGRLPSAA